MTVRLWSLPVDIPWKRLAINDDMYATDWDSLPEKWRSSLAVYSHEPEPDPAAPEDPDERTMFLKVVVSITGFQPQVPKLQYSRHKAKVSAWKKLDVYYPAYSALLQVAVFPEGGEWNVGQYPYFSDFEPKKREVVELVSDTGEFVTQSNNALNVRKGSTTTDSTEKASIDRGGSTGADVKIFGSGVGAEKSGSREVGTRTSSGSEGVNILNTDTSQEKRETYSHTTNLSQLYELLDSYHQGTNRAVFFVNARPHLMQSPYTFVNGPRKLEGVQEFFLVVRRPKDMEKICVKAVLETAHLHETSAERQVGKIRYDEKEVTITQRLDAVGENGGYAELSPGRWRIDRPSDKYELDANRGGNSTKNDKGCPGGYCPPGADWSCSFRTNSRFVCDAYPTVRTFFDHVEFDAEVSGASDGPGWGDYTLTAFFKTIEPVEQPKTVIDRHFDIFVTANQVTSCRGHGPSRDYISFERDVTELVKDKIDAARSGGPEGAIAANAVSRIIREELARSISSPERYSVGKVDFLTTTAAIRTLQADQAMGRTNAEMDRPAASIAPEALQAGLEELGLTIGDLLTHSPDRLADRLDIDAIDARRLMLAAFKAGSGRPTPSAMLASGHSHDRE